MQQSPYNYYLAKLGIQEWLPRQTASSQPMCLELLKANQLTGYLVFEDTQAPSSVIMTFLKEMTRSLGLSLGEVASSPETFPQKIDLVIFMGENSANIQAKQHMTLPYGPAEIINFPMHKKQIWEKIRNFTSIA